MAQTAELAELIHSGIGLGTKGVHNIVPQTHSLGSTKKFIFWEALFNVSAET